MQKNWQMSCRHWVWAVIRLLFPDVLGYDWLNVFKNMEKKRGNPNPVRTKEFEAQKFKPVSDVPDEPLSKRDLQIKVGQSVHEYLYSLPQRDRINLMRQAITEAVQKHKDGGL
jgi:hypothetical protein